MDQSPERDHLMKLRRRNRSVVDVTPDLHPNMSPEIGSIEARSAVKTREEEKDQLQENEEDHVIVKMLATMIDTEEAAIIDIVLHQEDTHPDVAHKALLLTATIQRWMHKKLWQEG